MNKVVSTGSSVMVGRMVGVKVGMGVSPANGVSFEGMLVAPWVLTAKRSIVGIKVTVGRGVEVSIGVGTVGVASRFEKSGSPPEQLVSISISRSTFFFMKSSSGIPTKGRSAAGDDGLSPGSINQPSLLYPL